MRLFITLILTILLALQALYSSAPHAIDIVDPDDSRGFHTILLPFPYLESSQTLRDQHTWVYQGSYTLTLQQTQPHYFLLGPLCPCVGLIATGNGPLGDSLIVAHLDFLTDIEKLSELFQGWQSDTLNLTLHSVLMSEAEGYSTLMWGESFTMRDAHMGRSQAEHLDLIQSTLLNRLGLRSSQIQVSLHTTSDRLNRCGGLSLVDQYYAVDIKGKISCFAPALVQFPYLMPDQERLSLVHQSDWYHFIQRFIIDRLSELMFSKALDIRRHMGIDRMPDSSDFQKLRLVNLAQVLPHR